MNVPKSVRPFGRMVGRIVLTGLVALGSAPSALAEDQSAEIESLRREVRELRQREAENRARTEKLERLLNEVLDRNPVEAGSAPAHQPVSAATVESPGDALDRALSNAPASAPTVIPIAGSANDIWSAAIPGTAATARLVDVSVVTLGAAGGSSVGNGELGQLQSGAHDPNQNGFTLQQAELSLAGAVDPYFTGEAHIVGVVDGVELEEAFFTTTALPYGLQVEAGYALTEFGLINPLHAHAWDWLDQPVVASRMFGPEGTRSPGARAAWLLPTPFFSELHVGVQDANVGGFTPSFIGETGVGNRPNVPRDIRGMDDLLWLVRSNSAWDLTSQTALMLGASALYGPNETGPDGQTWIYGIDAKVRWRPANNFRGWPFVLWQTEVIGRSYKADAFVAGTDVDPDSGDYPDNLPGDTLHDGGFYTQLLYGFHYGWAAGMRAEYASGSGPSISDGVPAPRSDDSLRGNRLRLSPLLTWYPSEFSRLRLQYNYDDADFLRHGNSAHTVWVGAEILYGTHGTHKY